jgi:hypothetical protein
MTIIATSRSNEFPYDARFPFPYQVIRLEAPTPGEKARVVQKLTQHGRQLTFTQQERLERANSWLVMMLETSTGRDLIKIVHDSVNRLRHLGDDQVVYRAYEYLCFAGQYDLSVPEAILNLLDSRGHFYNLAEHPAGRGLIFLDDEDRASLRTQNSTIAREAFALYRRYPLAVAREFMDVLQPSEPLHHTFLVLMLRHMLLDHQEQLVLKILNQHDKKIDGILSASSIRLLTGDWAGFFFCIARLEQGDRSRGNGARQSAEQPFRLARTPNVDRSARDARPNRLFNRRNG